MILRSRLCHKDCGLLESLVLAAENGFDFVLVELLHVVASRAEVLAGSNSSGCSKRVLRTAAVAARRLSESMLILQTALFEPAELFFGDTDCIGKLAAILVDGVNLILGN